MRSVRFPLPLVVALLLVGAVRAEAQVTLAEAARQAAGNGTASLNGVVTLPPGVQADTLIVRLRDAVTGEVRGTTIAGPGGEFSFEGLDAAEYFIEVLNQSGVLLSVSSALAVGAGEVVQAVLRVPPTGALGTIMSNALASPQAFSQAASTVLSSAASSGVTGMGTVGPAVSPER